MLLHYSLLALLALAVPTTATQQLPQPPLLALQNIDSPLLADPLPLPVNQQQQHRIAVIGSGAAGSSFVHYFNQRAADSGMIPAAITVFERDVIVGGRARVHLLNVSVCDPDCIPETVAIELGASIFASSNLHLMNFTKQFGLEIVEPGQDKLADKLFAAFGVWDGAKWQYLESPPSSKWFPGWHWFGSTINSLKLLAQYGFFNGPIQAASLARIAAERFYKIYQRLDLGDYWTNVATLAGDIGLQEYINVTSKFYFESNKISSNFISDFVGGICRNTYLQEIDAIHAMGSLVALYSGTNDMYQVKGGNRLIFERILNSTDVQLGNAVERVTKVVKQDGGVEYLVQVQSGEESSFDTIIMAAPVPASSIDFVNIEISKFPIFRYVRLFVTLVVGVLDPVYFGLTKAEQIPRTLLTPSPSQENLPFNCLSILKALDDKQVIVKIFSKEPLTKAQMDAIFTSRTETVEHAWDRPGSYPVLPPKDGGWSLDVQVDDSFYYVNAFEGLFSTMESEVMAGRNVAGLLANKLISKRTSTRTLK